MTGTTSQPMRRIRTATALLLAGLLVLPAFLGNPAIADVEQGSDAPDFTLPNIRGGEEVSLSSRTEDGKWVMLDFWATWCGPCISAMRHHLGPLHESLGGADTWELISIGTNWRNNAEQQLEFADENNYNWTFVFDEPGDTTQAYGVRGIPTIVVIDPNGVVQYYGHNGEAAAEILMAGAFSAEGALDEPTVMDGESMDVQLSDDMGRAALSIEVSKAGTLNVEGPGLLALFDGDKQELMAGTGSLSCGVYEGETIYLLVTAPAQAGSTATIQAIMSASMSETATGLSLGESVEGTVEAEGSALYHFQAEEAGRYTFQTMIEDESDTVMELLNGRGQVIAGNDDYSRESLASRIQWALDAGEDCYVRVMGYGGAPANFSLQVTN